MEIGKLSNSTLKDSIISRLAIKNSDVLVGPGVGEDCAIIDFGSEVCVLTTDPITAAVNNIGTLGVHISCNDIASAGVKPVGVMVTILAPPQSTLTEIEQVMQEVNKECDLLGIDVLGGHTEVTDAVNRMVLSITAIGKSKGKHFVRTGGANVGDDILVTGYAGLEGTAIVAHDYQDYLTEKVGKETVRVAQEMLEGISVVKAGAIAAEAGVSAMHDATEGGVLGAIWEIAEASGLGMTVFQDQLPLKEETQQICEALGINPFRLISSGCMIITTSAGAQLSKQLSEQGIHNCIVGKITEQEMLLNVAGMIEPIEPPDVDELFRIKI